MVLNRSVDIFLDKRVTPISLMKHFLLQGSDIQNASNHRISFPSPRSTRSLRERRQKGELKQRSKNLQARYRFLESHTQNQELAPAAKRSSLLQLRFFRLHFSLGIQGFQLLLAPYTSNATFSSTLALKLRLSFFSCFTCRELQC